jgi:membrane associated rhomboid family serine protease
MTYPPVPETPTPQSGVPTCYRHPGRETYISCQRCGRPICPDCMRDAAVGFHCPTCVAEGAKSMRAGRTAYGGQLPGNAALTSQVLIGINAAVWLLIMVTGGNSSLWVGRLALLPDDALWRHSATEVVLIHGVAGGAWWQLVTSMFTHVEIWHIGFNMLALWVLGPQLELALGRVRFLALYFGSGLAGSALVYWLAPTNQSTLGASGAIFGLMGALLIVALKVGGNVQSLLGWIGINFLITVAGRGYISWQGHLGGFLGGLALAAILVYAPRERRSMWQTIGVCVVVAAILVAIVARTVVING